MCSLTFSLFLAAFCFIYLCSSRWSFKIVNLFHLEMFIIHFFFRFLSFHFSWAVRRTIQYTWAIIKLMNIKKYGSVNWMRSHRSLAEPNTQTYRKNWVSIWSLTKQAKFHFHFPMKFIHVSHCRDNSREAKKKDTKIACIHVIIRFFLVSIFPIFFN